MKENQMCAWIIQRHKRLEVDRSNKLVRRDRIDHNVVGLEKSAEGTIMVSVCHQNSDALCRLQRTVLQCTVLLDLTGGLTAWMAAICGYRL
ncbi:MAG TPA: hypothetical protein PKD64_08710 [Pirellulaceae bacterium]|nr:hypothetical protein [Pirellulaceae bacterium]HMO92268.1 hypothetical protein [Pirellulaceae bacterium]HMP70085.1 hypothetical protein [Pirellulaceae bacterium]